MDKKRLTKRQWEYIWGMSNYFLQNDQFPASQVLSVIVGSTHNAAAEMYRRLERYGIVAHNAAGKYKRGPKWPL